MRKLILAAAAVVVGAGVSGAAFAEDHGHDAAAPAAAEAPAVDTAPVEEAVKAAGYTSWGSVTQDAAAGKWHVVDAVKADGTTVNLDVDAATLAVTEAAAH